MARAERTLNNCLARGTVAIRSHTNIESDTGLRGIEAMVELRERVRERATLQVVAHLTTDAPRKLEASRRWLADALAAGVDVIGGVPQNADDPENGRLPGGESVCDVRERAWNAVETITGKYQNGTMVTVTHYFVIMSLVCHVLKLPLSNIPNMRLAPATVTVFTMDGNDGARLVLFNDGCHYNTTV